MCLRVDTSTITLDSWICGRCCYCQHDASTYPDQSLPVPHICPSITWACSISFIVIESTRSATGHTAHHQSGLHGQTARFGSNTTGSRRSTSIKTQMQKYASNCAFYTRLDTQACPGASIFCYLVRASKQSTLGVDTS